MTVFHRQLTNITSITTKFIRRIHLVDRSDFQNRYKEFKIPVPWGHIAGKWWGPTNQRPILCLHGWQESCGSFDPLFKLLPANLSLLSFDFPGHGLSSHLPKGVYYHKKDAPILIRRIKNYFAWPKVSLLGHSRGAVTSFIYAALYSDDVDLLVGIDAIKPVSEFPGSAIKSTLESIDQFLKYEALNESETQPPSYTIQEMIDRMYEKTHKSIDKSNCKYILERIIKQIGDNRYIFSQDNRLKAVPLIAMHHTYILESAKRLKCPTLVLKATNSTYYEKKEHFYEVIDILKLSNPDFYCKYVKGTHHVHVNSPELVQVHINEFLDKYNLNRSKVSINKDIFV